MLRALLLTRHHDPGGDVGDAHGRIGGVHVLAARARRPVGVDTAIGFFDLDLDPVVDDGIDPDAGEAGVAARARIVGRNPHQPVHARLGLEPAIGIVALDQERGALDPGFVAVRPLDDLDFILPALGPAAIHALEHVGPVLALGAAGARMDFEIGIEAVRLAGEQGLDLAARGLLLDGADAGLAFLDAGLVVLHLAEFDQRMGVLEVLRQLLDRVDGVIELGALAHDLLGRLGIVPKLGVLGSRVQLREAFLDGIPVKDASSAVRSTAWRHPRVVRSRRASGVSGSCFRGVGPGDTGTPRWCKRPAAPRSGSLTR
ncbi:hypothetical protein CFIICLFH_0113 [Methylobacterium goesingense]|nr:hypothetical protein CFIICLFH_0113 [Methylobacterium goesingense]